MATKIKIIEQSRFLSTIELNNIAGGKTCPDSAVSYELCPANTLYNTCSAPIGNYEGCVNFVQRPCFRHVTCIDFYDKCGVLPGSHFTCGGEEVYNNKP